jgi:hypothetical protein
MDDFSIDKEGQWVAKEFFPKVIKKLDYREA